MKALCHKHVSDQVVLQDHQGNNRSDHGSPIAGKVQAEQRSCACQGNRVWPINPAIKLLRLCRRNEKWGWCLVLPPLTVSLGLEREAQCGVLLFCICAELYLLLFWKTLFISTLLPVMVSRPLFLSEKGKL